MIVVIIDLQKSNIMTIAIDFDGTCVTHDWPKIGKDIGAIPVLKELVNKGHLLILYTMRSDKPEQKSLTDAINWFKENDIPLYGIQKDPHQLGWSTSNKCYAQLYIDDAGLGIPLKSDSFLSHREFVDWEEVKKLLINLKIL